MLAAVQSCALANSLVDELTLEKDRLSHELYTLRTAKEMMAGGSSLAEVVLELRRKISTLELLQKVRTYNNKSYLNHYISINYRCKII